MFPNSKNKTKINIVEYEKYFVDTLHQLFNSDLLERKKLTRHIGVCDRTIRNWLHNQTKPNSYDLILLMNYSKAVFDIVLKIILDENVANEIICYMQLKGIHW
ncbi:hypothetical protein DKL61_02600 [Gammaproteobacteria bacterium ESL0073]|nr:hypothetical protein DKL61_02600 [Gammaproteobacteria bacterium ESL0073]